MDAFRVHKRLIRDYREFSDGFVDIRDERVRAHVEQQADAGAQRPAPWLALNPSFEGGGTVADLVSTGVLHPECEPIFQTDKPKDGLGGRPLVLHRHQRDAIDVAQTGASYAMTTGTGSGKSLGYIVPIVDRVLREGSGQGIKAIVVYPMNALANSQMEELRKFLTHGYGHGNEPVTFDRYTGQDDDETRQRILRDPPDILLTNYVMLELVLTRPGERSKLIKQAHGLRFLVLDELHTYRGRQGADVAMLVRRTREACQADDSLQCVGTSATMATGETQAQQRVEVADVASRLFGTEVTSSAVISEALQRTSAEQELDQGELAAAVRARGAAEADDPALHAGFDALRADPLASWIEDTFGLAQEPETGALIRRNPTTVDLAASALSEETGLAWEACGNAIRATLLAGSRAHDPRTRRPLFAFRLHQFLSKGGSVYVTAEPEGKRAIESAFQVELPGGRRLYPLAFCRECGQEYLMVTREHTVAGEERFKARHGLRPSDRADGYLYVSDARPWPQDPIAEERFPTSWLEQLPGGPQVIKVRRDDVPRRKWLSPDGTADTESPDATLAAWIPGAFRFCLTCGISYEAARSSELAKLVTLDKEGRSSAMSVIASSVLRSLREITDADFPDEARKLLTFVDNRQDASLQAGHFNDFALVVQLRSALYRAVCQADERGDGLSTLDLAPAVMKALNLDVTDYAASPDTIPLRARAERALRDVIEYRALRDLQYGWRVTLPNLEQTGLMSVEYEGLDTLAAENALWQQADPYLGAAPPAVRKELVKVLFDEMRRALALQSDVLTADFVDRLRRGSRDQLVGLWAVPEREPDPPIAMAIPSPGGKGGPRGALHLTGRGAFGRWLRQEERFGVKITTSDADQIIENLLALLHDQGYLDQITEFGKTGYRLNVSLLLLRRGAGQAGVASPIRQRFDSDRKPRVVPFFRDLYGETAHELAGLRAAEHTAQVRAEDRQEREREFGDAKLPLLFCSPTMELGVDIRSLNAVGLRNVPPTPANYAQRSGRAGRSGQPALVVTYCSSGNSHDTYYFERSELMVAGKVQPPRLDLVNENLVRSHVHAIWLAETQQPLGRSMESLLDLDRPDYPLTDDLRANLSDPGAKRRAVVAAQAVLGPLREQTRDEAWWHDGWVAEVVDGAVDAFDAACTRWRQLYLTVEAELDDASENARDASAGTKDREDAGRRWGEARQRMELLLNQTDSGGQSDFYPYRYLASEGFLPGYSFPRLPLAAYIPGMPGRGNTWLQRPRFLALSEFGPKALIYHEGARYEVTRINLPRGKDGQEAGEVVRSQTRVCGSCGYHHPRELGADVCDHCEVPLGKALTEMLQMQTVVTRRRERISADEEERNRVGFEMLTSYRFVPRRRTPGYLAGSVVHDEETAAELYYGDAAEIRVINLGRKRRKNKDVHGFWLNLAKGTWLNESDGEDGTESEDDGGQNAEDVKNKARVIPFVEDRRNILVFRWADAVDRVEYGTADVIDHTESITLQFALERGIEAVFQLEDSELTSELLPDLGLRGRTMFIEAAEGGAGVLRRLQSEGDALQTSAREALRIIHVDPETGEERDEACVRGCYRCLLSYGNQSVHEQIDRRRAVPHLLRLARSRVRPERPEPSGPEQFDSSRIEETSNPRTRELLRLIDEHDLRSPERVNAAVEGYDGRIDLVYHVNGITTAVILQAPEEHHHPDTTGLQLDLGWNVVEVPSDKDLDDIVSRNPSVFGVQEAR